MIVECAYWKVYIMYIIERVGSTIFDSWNIHSLLERLMDLPPKIRIDNAVAQQVADTVIEYRRMDVRMKL